MPPAEDIQRQLYGSWRMMTGRRDGIRLLDLSVDGFWNSFFAIVVALPVLLVSWVPLANELAGPDTSLGIRLGYLLRIAVVDIAAWILPLVILGAVAGHAGIRDRFVPYVVATNWGGALFSWFMLPVALLGLLVPDARDLITLLSLLIFVGSLVLLWRLTDAALGKGAGMATGVFFGVLIISIVTLLVFQSLLGIAPA